MSHFVRYASIITRRISAKVNSSIATACNSNIISSESMHKQIKRLNERIHRLEKDNIKLNDEIEYFTMMERQREQERYFDSIKNLRSYPMN